MKTIVEINKENLNRLIVEFGGVAQLAAHLERSYAQISQWKNASKDSQTKKPRGIKPATVRWIEEKCGKPKGWMDRDHSQPIQATDHKYLANVRNTIPTASELDEMLRGALVRLLDRVKDEAKPKGVQTYLADKLEVESSFISNIVGGRKTIGDALILKLDDLYPGWRAIDEAPTGKNTLDESNPNFGALLGSLIDPNTFKKQLDYCYEGMSQEHREALVMMANRLHNIDHPESGIANPAGKNNKKKVHNMGTQPAGENHARESYSDKRTQK